MDVIAEKRWKDRCGSCLDKVVPLLRVRVSRGKEGRSVVVVLRD